MRYFQWLLEIFSFLKPVSGFVKNFAYKNVCGCKWQVLDCKIYHGFINGAT